MRSVESQIRGVVDSIRHGHGAAHALAVADSRSFVRSLFLASAVRLDVLGFLQTPRHITDIARRTGCERVDRLEAWLSVGVELRELGRRTDHYTTRGRRARALAGGDPLLTAHYRSMLDYQAGPYDELDVLLREPDHGRNDLDAHARVIAEVSLAAAPFVIPFVRAIVHDVKPARVLDVGCGSGVYTRALLEADPHLRVDAIDLSDDVVTAARDALATAGLADRAELHVGDIREWQAATAPEFDVVTLINNIYYFDIRERVALSQRLRSLLRDGGALVVVTMTTPGSIAGTHLNFMLTSQQGAASLPRSGDIERDFRDAGFTRIDTHKLVPTEPFIGITAHR
jgi:4-hydroxy-2,2'-bipyrrole-5-carbaldehyde O-methyltransferase